MTRTTAHSNQRTRTRIVENVPFSALDEERQASMADEGGVSGALMELDGQEQALTTAPLRSPRSRWKVALGLAILGIAVIFVARRYPSR
jgi:hypothetical protein